MRGSQRFLRHRFDTKMRLSVFVVCGALIVILELLHSQYTGTIVGFIFGTAINNGVRRILS